MAYGLSPKVLGFCLVFLIKGFGILLRILLRVRFRFGVWFFGFRV